MEDLLNYMGYEWLSVDDGVVTVGLTEDAVADFTDEVVLNLPEQDDSVQAGKICGDIESDSGNINLYSPVSGTVLEVNEALLENSDLLLEDPTDAGWLFKIEADDPDKLDRLSLRTRAPDDDDEDDDDDDEDEDEEEESEDDGYKDE
jgi:glycine cleavage system H protein